MSNLLQNTEVGCSLGYIFALVLYFSDLTDPGNTVQMS